MIYEYKCQRCGYVEHREFPMGEAPNDYYGDLCPDSIDLRHIMHRVYTPPAIHFKGRGFHKTDYGGHE